MTQCVILNASHEPLAVVPPQRGLVLFLEGKAIILEQVPNRTFRSVSAEFPVPLRVILKDYVAMGSRYYTEAILTNNNLFLRDHFTCQYCGLTDRELGGRGRLTRDHVLPRSRGGRDVWENVVTACGPCNHRKASHTLAEAGLRLERKPRAPTVFEIMQRRDARMSG